MPEPASNTASESRFAYVAIDASGRRVKGLVGARNDAAAFEQLKRDGLTPVRLGPAKAAATAGETSGARRAGLSQREVAELLSDLAALLKAGADIRAGLAIIGAKAGQPALQTTCRALAADISGGEALDRAFTRRLPARHAFVAALIAAGEASGDLPGGLQRSAEVIEARMKISEQLWSVMSYPLFVLVSTLVALSVILLFVVPSLAPLAEAPGAKPGLAMDVLLAISGFLQTNLSAIGVLLALGLLGLLVAGRAGVLAAVLDRLALDGPARRTFGSLVFGGFAGALGNVLAAGAPMSDALRLATRGVRSALARRRLEPVAHAVRQGEPLSTAFGQVKGFPPAIVRLAAIGEASGVLGAMLVRGGDLEEKAALRRIEAAGRLMGPALIVLLGGLIGLIMAGLLSGVSGLGEAAMQ